MADEKNGERFTKGQAEAMEALLSGRNVFLSGNAGTGKSYVLNAFIEELEDQEVPYLAMAPTGIAALNLKNGTTIHRTLQIGHGLLDPNETDRRALTRKVLQKAEVVIIDEVSMCRIDLFERVMNMVLAAGKSTGKKQVVLVGDFFQLPPVVPDADRPILMSWYPGNEERVEELVKDGGKARTYTALSLGDVKSSDKATDDSLRLIEGARVMLLANMPDHGLSNGSLGTVVETGDETVTVEFDDCPYEVEVEPKEWKVLKSTIRDAIGKDGKPTQELVTDTVGSFTQIPLRLAFAITIHKSQGQTFDRCAVHTKVFGAGMLYVALSRCTTFDGLTVWPKIERSRLYANQAVIDFYRSLEEGASPAQPQQAGLFDAPVTAPPAESDGMVPVMCPVALRDKVQGYIDALMSAM